MEQEFRTTYELPGSEEMRDLSKRVAQPYMVKVINESTEQRKAIVLGGIRPAVQQDGITVISGTPKSDMGEVSYEDILIEMFLQITTIGLINFYAARGHFFKKESVLLLRAKSANGNTAQRPFVFGGDIKIQAGEAPKAAELRTPIILNVFQHFIMDVQPKSEGHIYFYPTEIIRLMHGKEIYEMLLNLKQEAVL